MQSTKSAYYTAPAIAARIVEFKNNGSLPPYVVVENLGTTASASVIYQESDDGSTWTDIASTTTTVNPGTSNGQKITSTKAHLALKAGGNVPLLVSVHRTVNGSPASLGAA
jgi:hypothetical protein